MALTRKLLQALGIEANAIEQIIEAHTDTVNGLKEEANKYKEKADRVDEVEKELEDANSKLETATKNDFENKYNELKTEYDKYKADVTSKETLANKTTAYKELLKKAGISEKRYDAILKISDVNGLEFNEDGTVKDADKLTEGLKTEWADFVVTEGVNGANVNNPPENHTGETDLGKLSMKEYIEARRKGD